MSGHNEVVSRLDDKRASIIRKKFEEGSLNIPDTWVTLQDLMVEFMIVFDKAFRRRLARPKTKQG